MLVGYFLYRAWAYASAKAPSAYMSFPFFNLSTASILLLFTILNDIHQVGRFLQSLYDQKGGLSRLDLIVFNYNMENGGSVARKLDLEDTLNPNSLPMLILSYASKSKMLMVIFQISFLLVAFHKYYELKNFVFVYPYRKALFLLREDFNKSVWNYRGALCRPGKPCPPIHGPKYSVSSSKDSLSSGKGSTNTHNLINSAAASLTSSEYFLSSVWAMLFFSGLMLAIFGAMLENTRLNICGLYTMWELGWERIDAGMSWLERKLPFYEWIVEIAYSDEEKKENARDLNGRELPMWLREAEEKEEMEKSENFADYSKKVIVLNFLLNYGIKAFLIYSYMASLP